MYSPTFLGIGTIDKSFISDNKVAELQSKLSSIISSKIVNLKDMESLCGSHNLYQGHAWQNGF